MKHSPLNLVGILTLHSRVLVVDDEAPVRDAMSRTLSRLGCEVECAASGEAALAIVGASPRPFDLVISDVIMRGMSGVDLLEELRAGDALLEVLLISGYPGNHLDNARLRLDKSDLLQKPFTPKQLTARVEQKLARVATRRQLDATHV